MNFSLVFPTRERVELLTGLIESVAATTDDLAQIEMLVAVDLDDVATVEVTRPLMLKYPWLKFIIGWRQNNLSDGYYNRLAMISQGRFVQVLNDDVVFATQHWDTLALPVLEAYQRVHPDGILYGRVTDDLFTGYSCFPLVSREALRAMGWFFHGESPGWNADVMLHQIYSHPEVNRVVQLPYHLEHLSHHTGKRERDQVNIRMGSMGIGNTGYAWGEAMRLRDIINSKATHG